MTCKMENSITVSTLGFGPGSQGSNPCSLSNKKQMKKLKLGDKVEKVIKTVLPKTYKRKKGCAACAKRKAFLNKI